MKAQKTSTEKSQHDMPAKVSHKLTDDPTLTSQHSVEVKGSSDPFGSKFASKGDRYRGKIVEFDDNKEYNPDVSLRYYDENGHEVKLKEAFKMMSHKFHGKKPGKNKEEKRIKKIEGQKITALSSLDDTPLKTVEKMRNKLASNKSAFIKLSRK